MSDLEIGRAIAKLEMQVASLTEMMQQAYDLLEYNIKAKKLSEPPENNKGG